MIVVNSTKTSILGDEFLTPPRLIRNFKSSRSTKGVKLSPLHPFLHPALRHRQSGKTGIVFAESVLVIA